VVAHVELDRAAHTQEDAVERPLIANDELLVAVKEIRVPWGNLRVVGEDELAVASDDVLFGVELVAEPFHALATDENELRPARDLELPEELRSSVRDLGGDRRATTTAELVLEGDRCGAGSTNEVLGLVHELLLGELR